MSGEFEAGDLALAALFGLVIGGGENEKAEKAKSHFNSAEARYDRGDYRGAIAEYSSAIKLDPRNPRAYYKRGAAYGMIKNYVSAIEDFSKAIESDPLNAEAYHNRGTSYLSLKNYAAAARDAKKARDLGDCELFQVMSENNLLIG